MALVNAFGEPLDVLPENLTPQFRDSFESFTNGVKWNLTQHANDIVQLDGNAASASYLVISKDPFSQGTDTVLETVGSFPVPMDFSVGFSMSQRILGQELSIEIVSDEATLSAFADLNISSISQSATTLTITTSTPHNLVAGARIGIVGVTSDSRLNYPSLVVSGVNSPNTIVCTGGPAGTIPSLTVGPYTNQGTLYYRPAMGYAKNGISEIFENATATNASAYVRADAGDALPTGTIQNNHSITVQTTAGTQALAYAYNYAWLPNNETRFSLYEDRATIHDAAPDATSGHATRVYRTQVIPAPDKTYKLRFRLRNNKGLTVPVAKIVSASKSGTTTATITTAAAHGLTTGDFVITYGIRNGTDFPAGNVTQVLSTPTSTTFTIVMAATTATVTSYGGLVARVNGGNTPASFNTNNTGAVQTVVVSSGEITLTGSGNWSIAIGDYVNLYGLRDNTSGADLGLDGTYKVSESSGTSLRLLPIGTTPVPANLGSTSCGGIVIKRTDLRLSFVRFMKFARQRVEFSQQFAQSASAPIFMTGGTIGGGTITTVSTVAASNTNFNQIVTDVTASALTSTTTSSTITPAASALSHEFNVMVTSVSGTNPTLDVVVQESDDSGTNWYDVYHFPRINAAGQYRSPLIPLTGNRVRYVQTVGGTSPSFGRSINRQQSNTSNPLQRLFIAYAAGLTVNTLNAVTASYFTEGCADLNVVVSMGAVTTTAPVLVVEQSMDNVNWIQVGADITTVANTNNFLQASNALGRFTRIRVKTAGSGATLNAVWVKGIGR